MGMSTINEIAGLVARLQNEKLALIHRTETQQKMHEEYIDEVLADFIQVVDTFEWAESVIKERGLDQSQVSTKAITRLLTAKTKALAVLEKYGVKRIELPDQMIDDQLCVIVGSERDSAQRPGTIVSVEKNGYTRDGRLLRAAEVIVVR